MYELYQYPVSKNAKVLNYSPFCAKLEMFLKVNNVEYVVKDFKGDPRSAPKGKLPFIKDGSDTISDSSLIIDYFKNFKNIDMDVHLSEQDKAISFSFKKMIEEYLYWIIIYSRWIDNDNWSKTREVFFGHLPFPLSKIIPILVRKSQQKAAYSQGISRHSKEEIYQMGRECFEKISSLLLSKRYFFGDKPSSIDMTMFGILSNIKYDIRDGSKVSTIFHEYKSLCSYIESLEKEFL